MHEGLSCDIAFMHETLTIIGFMYGAFCCYGCAQRRFLFEICHLPHLPHSPMCRKICHLPHLPKCPTCPTWSESATCPTCPTCTMGHVYGARNEVPASPWHTVPPARKSSACKEPMSPWRVQGDARTEMRGARNEERGARNEVRGARNEVVPPTRKSSACKEPTSSPMASVTRWPFPEIH